MCDVILLWLFFPITPTPKPPILNYNSLIPNASWKLITLDLEDSKSVMMTPFAQAEIMLLTPHVPVFCCWNKFWAQASPFQTLPNTFLLSPRGQKRYQILPGASRTPSWPLNCKLHCSHQAVDKAWQKEEGLHLFRAQERMQGIWR